MTDRHIFEALDTIKENSEVANLKERKIEMEIFENGEMLHIFLLPFFFRSVIGNYPSHQAISFILLGVGIILLNNFLSFYIDKRMAIK